MRPNRSLTVAALGAASVLALAGCATPASGDASGADDARIQVVASTNVYGQIAEQIGGDAVAVTSIVDSAAQDPHSYEASAQDQLTLADADLVIENGGGYDAFIDGLIEASGAEAHVITAVEFSHDYPGAEGHAEDDDHADDAAADEDDHAHEEGEDHAGHDHIEGFNEHVWYDPHTIEHVAEAIAEELSELAPEDAETFQANAEEFLAGIGELEGSLEEIGAAHGGTGVFVTEPVPVYLLAAAGLENVTPEAFSEAVEEGQDVAPATLLEALGLVEGGDARVVITNAQTGGAETTQIVTAAEEAGIPVLEFTETLPDGQTYLQWMQQNIDDLAAALGE